MTKIYFLLLILFANKFISNIVAVQLIVEKTCNPKPEHGPDHCDIQHHKFYLVPNGRKHEHLQKQEHKEKEKEKEQEKIQIHQIWVDEKVAVFKHNGELFLFHKKYIKKCEIGYDEQNEIMPHPGKIEEGSDDDGEMMDKISIDIASNDEDDDGKGISKRNLLKNEIVKKENHIGKRKLFHKLLINLFACGTKQWKSKNKDKSKTLKNFDTASNSKSHSHHHHHISIDKKEEEKLDTYSARSSFHRENSVAEDLSHLDAPNTAIAANEADEHSTISDSTSAVGHKIGKNVEKIIAKFHQNPSHSFIQPETIINRIQLIQNITENEKSNTADEIGRKASADGDIHSESEGTDKSTDQAKKKHAEKLFDENNSESEGTSSLNEVNKVHSPLIVCNKEEKWLKVGNVIIKEREEKCIAKVNVPEKKLLEGSVFRVKDEKEDELFYNLEQFDGQGHKTHFIQKTDIMQKIKIDKDLEECMKEVCREHLLNIETVNSIETIYKKEERKLD